MPPVRRPSGSKVDRALACAASCWLPAEDDSGPSHPAASRGTRLHKALERSFLTSREADIYHGLRPEEIPLARRAIAGRPYLATAFIHWPLVEVECWYNPLTTEAAFGSCNGDENDEEALPPGWWRMRADAIGRSRSETLGAWDWKTGSPRHQTPPGRSAQVHMALAFLAGHPDSAKEVDASNGAMAGVYLTQSGQPDTHWAPLHATDEQKRQAEKDKTWPDIASFQKAAMELEAKLAIVEAGGPEAERVMAENPPVLNKGCFFCPSKKFCPTFQEKNKQKGADNVG